MMLKINGKIYETDQLKSLCKQYFQLNGWESDIYHFIEQWFNENEFINVQTSGSTGEPKIIQLKKNHLIQSAKLTCDFFALNNSCNALLCLPVKYIAGKMMIVRAFIGQFNLITIAPTVNPFENINEPIDFVAITPHQLAHSIQTLKDKKIKNIIVGGADISPILEKEAQLLPSNIFATYGMTETASHVAIRRINGKNASNLYEALPPVTFDIDELNRLIIHANYFTYSPIYTNDIVKLIDNKHFIWIGRYDNVINSGGIKVFPEEVEKKISPFIPCPFFIGPFPDNFLSEIVCLYLETSSSKISTIVQEELIHSIKPLLEKHQLPRKIVLLEKFVYSPNGKLLRKETVKKAIKKF